ncbi:DUF3159 domain-containing protein [Streptomyces olivaceus]
MVANTQVDARVAALISLGAALLAACVRRLRGEGLAVVGISTAMVGLHSASAFAIGEGRAYFLPEFVINGGALVICLISLKLGRPMTAVAYNRLGVAADDRVPASANVRRHRLLTLGWTVMWAIHLVLIGFAYWLDSVPGLTAAGTFNKVTLFSMVALTLALGARWARSDAGAVTEPTSACAPSDSSVTRPTRTAGQEQRTAMGSEGSTNGQSARE